MFLLIVTPPFSTALVWFLSGIESILFGGGGVGREKPGEVVDMKKEVLKCSAGRSKTKKTDHQLSKSLFRGSLHSASKRTRKKNMKKILNSLKNTGLIQVRQMPQITFCYCQM